MKVTTDSCLFGAWTANRIKNEKPVRPPGGLISNNVLDIGTGTGLLALMYAQNDPQVHIDAIETDKEAFQQASENIAASPWKDRIKTFHSDAMKFDFLSRYDVIISNPPFYENESKADDKKKNIARHNEGMLFHELITVIKKTLAQTGTFYLLLPFKRNDEIKHFFTDHEFIIEEMVFIRQSVNHGYFRIMLSGTHRSGNPVETRINEISICNDQQQYSAEFIDLLKEYYLNL